MTAEAFTFLVPHQRAPTGGVYSITELARSLASDALVNLVVGKGELREVPGVNVIPANGLRPDALPDADVLVGGLAQGPVDQVLRLPDRHGAKVFLFQGYGAPGNRLVRAALAKRLRVLAIARFLADEARRSGCKVGPIALGLDRRLFWPGPPADARRPVVSMITHGLPWKGTADGLEALRIVREAVPGADVVLFGEPRSDVPGRFLPGLSGERGRIAEVLRRSAVFVCPSWEEGLGLPGIEALACGASLATTDTKGGRDYAIHERTALVSPPHRPEALAASILRLLRDPPLRAQVAVQGRAHVLGRYPSWEEAAARFRRAVAELLDDDRNRSADREHAA